jgi:hypothetical protein
MRTKKIYLLWGISLADVGFIISIVVTVGLLTGFMIRLIFSHTLRWIPISMLAVAGACFLASVVLMGIGFTKR